MSFRPETFAALRDYAAGEQARMAAANAAAAGTTSAIWRDFQSDLRSDILERAAAEFFRWPFVSRVLAPQDGELFQTYSRKLRLDPWFQALCEQAGDVDFGEPHRCAADPGLSPIHIQHLFHLSQLHGQGGPDLARFATIVEFGGGYGNMARLTRRLGFTGRYIVYDLPIMNRVQHMFLQAAGIEAAVWAGTEPDPVPTTLLVSDMAALHRMARERAGDGPMLLIGTWSLSEAPIRLRSELLSGLAWDALLLAYQPFWDSIDNRQYFDRLETDCAATHEFAHYPVPDYGGQRYLIGFRRGLRGPSPPPLARGEESTTWILTQGNLASISVGADGSVWGLTADGAIFRRNGGDGAWQRVPGLLKQIAVGDALHIWGIAEAATVLRYTGADPAWEQVPGRLSQIAASGDQVWGISPSGEIFRFAGQ